MVKSRVYGRLSFGANQNAINTIYWLWVQEGGRVRTRYLYVEAAGVVVDHVFCVDAEGV